MQTHQSIAPGHGLIDLAGRDSLIGGALREHTMSIENGQFDPQTLAVLKSIFEEACRSLPPHRRTPEVRSELAVRILKLAVHGGLDSARLRTCALMEAASSSLGGGKDL